MELWIRSQDREILKKVNGIEFIQSGSPLYEGIKYSIYESDENGKKMGEYKTKERALEVLDEIHERIAILTIMGLMGMDEENAKVFSKYLKEKSCGVVYQMPEE